MRKIYLLFFVLIPFFGNAEKVLTQFIDEDGTSVITYDANGHITDITITAPDEPDAASIKADRSKFSQGIVSLTWYTGDEYPMTFEAHVDNAGRATEITHPMFSMTIYKFTYDAEGQLVSVYENLGDMTSSKTLTWENGNLVKIYSTTDYEGRSTTTTVETYYTDAKHPSPLPNKGGSVGSVYATSTEIDEIGWLNVLQLFNLTGKKVNNLPLKVIHTEQGHTPDVYIVDYILDSEGYPIEGIEDEHGTTDHTYFTWGEIQAGISDVVPAERTVAGYYNLNGMKLDKPANGINIVRYSDGSCEKLIESAKP